VYTDSSDDIHGVYSSLAAVNDAVREVVDEEYDAAEDFTEKYESDGRLRWSSDDVGEGDAVEIVVQKWEVQGEKPAPKSKQESTRAEKGNEEGPDDDGEEEADY
jgi:hypothetical protein